MANQIQNLQVEEVQEFCTPNSLKGKQHQLYIVLPSQELKNFRKIKNRRMSLLLEK